MNEHEIQKLKRARTKMEQKLRDLDLKVNHLIWKLQEEHPCVGQRCALREARDALQRTRR